MVLALPMEIVGPVLGIGAIVTFIAGAVIAVRVAASRFPILRDGGAIDQARDQQLDELHARVTELEQMKQRVAELEERVDFAERLLARRDEAPRIGPGLDG